MAFVLGSIVEQRGRNPLLTAPLLNVDPQDGGYLVWECRQRGREPLDDVFLAGTLNKILSVTLRTLFLRTWRCSCTPALPTS